MLPADPTPYADINQLLKLLLSGMQKILGAKLIGLYLYGSLVIGDFDPKISDIDLVAALSSDIDDKEFGALQKMHDDVAKEHKEWDDRIEVCYISVAALHAVRSSTSQIANISPGEPFHKRESSKEWLTDWYVVREKGITLFGPSPKTIIEPISKDEFIHSVKANAKAWRLWIHDMHTRKSQAYAILTLCRALYTYKDGEQVSKKQAALWAEKEFLEWSFVIQNALLWREAGRDENVDHDATFPETLGFVHFIISQFEKEAIRKAQELVNTYLPADRSLSDELIVERRMED
jgi:Aminoglycoside adenylyltransferase, C-terminal domain/Nucleotidyltransferase domain